MKFSVHLNSIQEKYFGDIISSLSEEEFVPVQSDEVFFLTFFVAYYSDLRSKRQIGKKIL